MQNYFISKEKINVQDLLEWVEDPSCGAICSFIGTVRELTYGKKTYFLEYQAYQEMAEKMLQEISIEILTQYHCTKVAMVHRIGHLNIGDVAVAIAISAPHRPQAFAGCRYAIEEVKKRVPIWKKEYGEDGSYWVGIKDDK